MQIKLNLILSLIVEAVKAETYIKGTIDRAAGNDQHASNGVSYHETAGDEEVHERKILRDIYTSSDKLRTFIQDYLVDSSSSVGSNIVVDINKDTDSIILTLEANNRFRKSNADSLARLCSKFIQDETLVLWWTAIGSQSQIQYYTTLANEDTTAIQRLFVKSAPRAVVIPYTSKITIMGGPHAQMTIEKGEETTITYTIDDDVIDDVEIVADCPKIDMLRPNSNEIKIKGISSGVCHVTLYSLHDETVYASLTIVVKEGDSDFYDNVHHHNHHFPRMTRF